MAISDICKFEFAAHVNKTQEERRCSRRRAVAELAAELGLVEETARKMDQRARKELGQIVPTKSKPEQPQPVTADVPKLTDAGGKRKGAGRKAFWKDSSPDKSEIMDDEFKALFEPLFNKVTRLKREKYRTTSKEAALKYINILIDVITIT